MNSENSIPKLFDIAEDSSSDATLKTEMLLKVKQKEKHEQFMSMQSAKDSPIRLDDFCSEVNHKSLAPSELPPPKDKSDKQPSTSKKAPPYFIALNLLRLYKIVSVKNRLCIFINELGFWDDIYENQVNTKLRRLIPDEYKFDVNKIALAEIFDWLMTEATPIDEEVFFKNGKYLNFMDGALNFMTGEFITGNERMDYYFPYYIPWEYLKIQELSNGSFKQYCHEVFKKDKQTRREFAKGMGLSISNIRNLKLSLILCGPPNSGKSVALNLIRALVGEIFCSSISFGQMASEFALTELCSKRVNTSGEMSGAGKLRLDIFKTLVGNDHTTASHKFKDHFQFKNRCLLLFASNHIPELDNYMEVDPFVSRLVVFPFSHQKSRHEWENNLNEMFLGDLKNIFDFAIEGLRALVEDNYEFIETDAMVVAKENFVGSQNSFSLFAKKYLAFKHDKKVLSCDIERYYSAFCQKRDFTPLSVKKWSNQLTNFYGCLNYTGTKGSYDMKGRRARGYRGVQLADNVSELDEFIRIPDEDVIGGLFDED